MARRTAKPKIKKSVVGPFTVESLSPHRVLGVDENDELIDSMAKPGSDYDDAHDFVTMILENLKTAGVQQAHKEDKVDFTSLTPWPGDLICAEGRYEENSELGMVNSERRPENSEFETQHSQCKEKRAAIFIGPDFGTVSRPDLVAAAHSDGAEGIACWFIDTDYNEESFFVRHACFLGANDPYKALKTTLKAEINEEAWESLHSDTSSPFDKPTSGRIAVKVINHLGDEMMKVFKCG